jgi:diguanylate cyclase (GGDEF)-like protein
MRAVRNRFEGLGLLGKFSVMSLVPILLLGLVLAHFIQVHTRQRSLDDARRSAEIITRTAIAPRLTPDDITAGLAASRVQELDRVVNDPAVRDLLARIKIWNLDHRVVYSDDKALTGQVFKPSDELLDAFQGRAASELSTGNLSENTGERHLGELLEVYVPLSFGADARTAGALEVYLPYGPIAASIRHDTRVLFAILAAGLLMLYLALWRIVARASRQLSRQAADNRHQATHDALTGLPNRTGFREKVQSSLDHAHKRDGGFALALIDLDRFKEINDALGHGVGDALLEQVAVRLRDSLRESDLVCRLGGDEFALILDGISSPAAAELLVQRLLAKLERPFTLDSVTLDVEASAGIAIYPDHGDDIETLIQRADVAMYLAKGESQTVVLYDAERDMNSPDRLALLGELRRAIEKGDLILHYQPKADLRSGRVTGVEALVRWPHPQRGLIGPDEFVPLAERTGLIRPLTAWVLRTTVRQIELWARDGIDVEVSVNVSARNVHDIDFPDLVRELLQETPAARGRLAIELTESAIMSDAARSTEVLRELSDMGVRLSIDDFGTGYSSLERLRELPVDEVKIDKSFIKGVGSSANDVAIVTATIELARSLGLRVVAEGVEVAEVWQTLVDLGADTAQGYFLSRPMDPAAALSWLEEAGLARHQPDVASGIAHSFETSPGFGAA